MRSLSILLLTISIFTAANLFASTKENVHQAINVYLQDLTKSKPFLPVVYKGKVLKLSVATSKKYPDGLHHGVKNKGNLYVSCVDFTDKKGNKYDIDFLVNKSDGRYIVAQPIVHKVNGVKNPYDLNH